MKKMLQFSLLVLLSGIYICNELFGDELVSKNATLLLNESRKLQDSADSLMAEARVLERQSRQHSRDIKHLEEFVQELEDEAKKLISEADKLEGEIVKLSRIVTTEEKISKKKEKKIKYYTSEKFISDQKILLQNMRRIADELFKEARNTSLTIRKMTETIDKNDEMSKTLTIKASELKSKSDEVVDSVDVFEDKDK